MFALAGAAAVIAAPALAQDNSRFTPIQPNDSLFTCEQLEQEAGVMEQTLGAAPGAVFSVDDAMGIGASVAMQAGAGGAARALGGLGGGIGGALGGLARNAQAQQQQQAEERREMAQDRWYYLAGIYMGKGCDQPPPPPPAPEPAALTADQIPVEDSLAE